MTTLRLLNLPFLLLAWLLLHADPAQAQTRQLTDEQIHTIEYHYKLDQYMVGGCLLGASFGAITGLLTLSGVSVIAAVPYISTGCSLGFLVGPATMVVRDYLTVPPAAPLQAGHHEPLAAGVGRD